MLRCCRAACIVTLRGDGSSLLGPGFGFVTTRFTCSRRTPKRHTVCHLDQGHMQCCGARPRCADPKLCKTMADRKLATKGISLKDILPCEPCSLRRRPACPLAWPSELLINAEALLLKVVPHRMHMWVNPRPSASCICAQPHGAPSLAHPG
jgi:hypothetical protein